MEAIPALDIRAGRVVRLVHGDFDREQTYAEDPVARAVDYARAGARRLHVVDLDAAAGRGSNRAVVERLVAAAGVAVQVAGGVRTVSDVEAWLAAGAAGVVMGTTAVRDPALLTSIAERHPTVVSAALDLRAGRPAVAGWLSVEPLDLSTVLDSWAAAALQSVVLTSIDRDGTLTGPDLKALKRVLALTEHRVVYSGGIASVADIEAVAEAGAAGVILGKALLDGRFTVAEAVAACAA
ncbi:MAG TPA: 1-(5-phosphoribosyl)-5-[(5-phosphoribosylamino)methylideneamino] imidazole-4-carboxamide isomerase [Candidatus Dormibacteraeota bacterium]